MASGESSAIRMRRTPSSCRRSRFPISLDLLAGWVFPQRTAAIVPGHGTPQSDRDRRAAVGRRLILDPGADLFGPPPRERHARILAERPAAGHAVVADPDLDGAGRGRAH